MSKNSCVKCLNVMNAIQRRGKVAKGEGGEGGRIIFSFTVSRARFSNEQVTRTYACHQYN